MFEDITKKAEIVLIKLIIFFNSFGLDLGTVPEYKVIKVIDGDTFEIVINQKISKVRMIGLNSPESVHPQRKIECYGIQASDRLKTLIEGKIVSLEEDKNQGDKDKYERLLRYVYLSNENLNARMIAEGYSFEYTYKKPYIHQREFKALEATSKSKNLGLWNSENCNY